jgi:LAO/AO transport system kinase
VIDPGELLERAVGGERRALGRLLSLAERGGEPADEIAELVHAGANGSAAVIGITGAPGTGKSTLVGHLVTEFAGIPEKAGIPARAEVPGSAGVPEQADMSATAGIPGDAGLPERAELGCKPAVLAVDPSSPLTGGAILGDRIRMDAVAAGRAFIRSMATRGHAGGLALAVPAALRVFEACGFGPVVVETVGVGQVEVDITRTADTTVVMVAPGMGDAVQANKSGLLEVADVLVVNKADRPGADDTRRDLEHMLDLGRLTGLAGLTQDWRPEIIMTTATTGGGADQVHRAIQAHRAHLTRTGQLQTRRRSRIHQEVLDRVTQQMGAAASQYLATQPAELREALEGHRTPAATAAEISKHLLSNQP